MKTSWEKRNGKRIDYVQVNPGDVVIGVHRGGTHARNSDFCSHDKFLSGMYQERIKRMFGQDVLEEVIRVVEEVREEDTPDREETERGA